MIYLLVMFWIQGELQQSYIPQPDFQTCAKERDLLLRTANREILVDLTAVCVVRVDLPPVE